MSDDVPPTRVFVTGFGPFLNITTNPSWELVDKTPTFIDSHNINITRLPVPTPAAYHKIQNEVGVINRLFVPELIVHIGLDVDSEPGVFKLERSAPREGYHDIPDVERKVYTRAENKKMFGKSPDSLVTTLDIDAAVEVWAGACSNLIFPTMGEVSKLSKSKSKDKSAARPIVQVRLSDDVGTYVCGFQYYVSMLEMQKRTGKRDVIFLHVPRLETNEEVEVGVTVVAELIKALVVTKR